MSERDWLSVVSDLNNEQVSQTLKIFSLLPSSFCTQNTSFGEVKIFERLIETCQTNLETLRNMTIQTEVAPKCLPQDLRGRNIL